MRKITVGLLSLIILVAASFGSQAQTTAEKKYTARAKEVEEEVLGIKDAMFSPNVVPQTYSQASAVVIAKKVQLYSDLKSKVKFSIFYGSNVTNTIRYTLTIREKIKIQDKHALDQYSEMAFSRIRNQSNFFRNRTNVFVGISLIKPDGSVKKIDVDEEAVNADSETDKDNYKLAIPGLQVGDIIDMYSRVEKESTNENPIEPVDLVIGGSYPILHYVMNTKVRNEFAVIYSASNGAEEPKETRDGDFIYLDMEARNIDKAVEDLWVYDRRELPVFKINIIPGITAKNRKANAPEKGQVLKGLSKKWIDADVSSKIMKAFYYGAMSEERIGWVKEYIKKINREKRISEMDPDSLIQQIFYYGRYSYLYDYMSESKIEVGTERNTASMDYNFYSYLLGAFNQFNVSYDIIFTVPRSVGSIHTTVSIDDFAFFVRAKGKKEYYLIPPGMFTNANSFPYLFEGQEAYVYKNTSLRTTGSVSEIEKLPFTKATFNYVQEKLDISLDPSNQQKVNIHRTKTVRGNPAQDHQAKFTLFEEYVDGERTRLGERKFSDEVLARVGKKRGAELLQEYEQAFLSARKQRDEFIKDELKSTFENPAISFTQFKVLQTGNRFEQRDFVFDEKFSIDGFLKKAGNNYILDMGSLVTGQVQVKQEQRTRRNNIHMPYARTYDYVINLEVPEGYTAEGIEKLNRTVENETGNFTSKASFEGGKIRISVTKVYNHYYEDAANWDKMLAFLDAAYEFSQQKVLLKKK